MTGFPENAWNTHLQAVQETIRVVGQGTNADESLSQLSNQQAELEDCLRLVKTQRELLAHQRGDNGHGKETEGRCLAAHTAQGRTIAEMARAHNPLSRPVLQESLPLSIDPDDSPLFLPLARLTTIWPR